MPFSNGKYPPAVLVREFQKHQNNKGRRYYVIIGELGEKIIINGSHKDSIQKTSEDEAKTLNKLFEESGFLSESLGTKTHFREDGSEKIGFDEDKFKNALYRLKTRFPEKDCGAYKCETCGKIHLGKL